MNVLDVRRIATAAAVLVGAAGVAVLGTTGAASAEATTHSCVVRNPISETAHFTFYDTGTPGEGPGDRVTFHNEIFDASGVQIGTADGGALIYTGSDGALYERIVAVDTYSDGRVSWTAQVLISSANSGEDQTATAVGLTGRYAGKTGARHFQVVGATEAGEPLFASSLSVCG
ncbi:allene oxide cyclase barrel-like domain-containing protein [Micromonospora sp. CA-240977]|uniref:allene oxide cyclase barrel-like domain-containing protein n=1 Tax=Micromonospora sp. CA-240977 TaxID=3239957 RepID=UPI003D9291AC